MRPTIQVNFDQRLPILFQQWTEGVLAEMIW